VADGHGGSRYWLSEVGSRLACELAIEHAARHLRQKRLRGGDPAGLASLHHWLAQELPEQVVAAWQQAIQADWQGRTLPPEHQGEPFSIQTYGSTLALVVLTPQWWAHTGLGDWDLVLLSDDQPDRIISQEAGEGLHGEATESLCLPRASRCFAARTALHHLSQPCGLVLSTDGLRKSCATDADHLALCRFLLEEAQPHEASAAAETSRLDTSLDRISREGSGDDVSVAIACFGTLQPIATNLPELPPLPVLDVTEPEHQLLGRALAAKPPTQRPRPKARRADSLLITLLLALAIASGLFAFGWLKRIPSQTRPAPQASTTSDSPKLNNQQTKAVRSKATNLCNKPSDLIMSTLNKRKDVARKSATQPDLLNQLLNNKDWQGSLIYLNRSPTRPAGPTSPPCPELSQALQLYWRQNTAGRKTPMLNQPVQPTSR